MLSTQATPPLALVAGGAGFIGSHLCDALLRRGWRVVAVDDLSTGSERNLDEARTSSHFRFILRDLRSFAATDLAADETPRVIFHLAAAAGVRLVIERPVDCLDRNLEATRAAARLAATWKCKLFFASSSEVYGSSALQPLKEDDPVSYGPSIDGARWSYGLGKYLDEMTLLQAAHTGAFELVIARLFNVVGPRQIGDHGMVLPRFIEAALASKPLRIYGDGSQRRTFLAVSDAVEAILALVGRNRLSSSIFNVGSAEAVSIRTLAEEVRDELDSGSELEFGAERNDFGGKFVETRVRVPDTSRLVAETGWRPTHGRREIIRRTADSRRQDAQIPAHRAIRPNSPRLPAPPASSLDSVR